MTSLPETGSGVHARRPFLAELRRQNPVLFWLATFHLLLLVGMLALAGFDQRTVAGANVWFKPMKFALSFAVYAATVGWLMDSMPATPQMKRRLTWTVAISVLIEMIAIAGQAARGVKSHFNLSSPGNAAIFGVMGLAILANTIAVAIMAWKFWRTESILPRPYLWGIRLGLVIFLLSSLEGFVMAGRLAHSVGVADGGAGLPFLNWSRNGGDLRASHFLGMHALQVLPLCGYAISRSSRRRQPEPGAALIIGIGIAYAIAVGLLFLQALMGRPLL
jgi:hypothetical protein